MASFASPDAPTVIAAGDKIPACEMHDGFPGVKGDAAKVMIDELCKGARAIPRAPIRRRFSHARASLARPARAQARRSSSWGCPARSRPADPGCRSLGTLRRKMLLRRKGSTVLL